MDQHSLSAHIGSPQGPYISVDGGLFYLDPKDRRLCIVDSKNSNTTCLRDEDRFEGRITDDQTGKVTGIVEKNQNVVYIWSVDEKGFKNKDLPYLKVITNRIEPKTMDIVKDTKVELTMRPIARSRDQ